ncbi:MAG: transglutaminase-like domain-containing protein [Myxococcota bacterium]
MQTLRHYTLFALLVGCVFALGCDENQGEARTFEFVYEATIQPGEAQGDVDIYLPVATSGAHQNVLETTFDSSVDGRIETESAYGNKYWHATLDGLPDQPLTIRATYRIERMPFAQEDVLERAGDVYGESVEDDYAKFLQANSRVPVDSRLVQEVSGDVGFEEGDSPAVKARKIYDYVVDTMEYKKVGKGWGNGDTYWACSERYGNCTDFHALLTSLARNQGIPSRFEIGFPIPTGRDEGNIGGYHCWLQVYLPDVGWTPIDASEAKKHPEKRDLLFGTQPADRISFSVGRDLTLGEHHDAPALNYFVYPHVEVGDQRYEDVETSFSYKVLESK